MAINDKFKMVSFSFHQTPGSPGPDDGGRRGGLGTQRSQISSFQGREFGSPWLETPSCFSRLILWPPFIPSSLGSRGSTGCSAPGSQLGPTEGPLSSGSLGGRGKGRGRHGAWGLGTLWWGCPACPLGGPQAGSRLWTPYLLAFCQPISLEVSHLASPGWGPTARPFLIHSLPSHVPRKSGNRSRGLLQKKLLPT